MLIISCNINNNIIYTVKRGRHKIKKIKNISVLVGGTVASHSYSIRSRRPDYAELSVSVWAWLSFAWSRSGAKHCISTQWVWVRVHVRHARLYTHTYRNICVYTVLQDWNKVTFQNIIKLAIFGHVNMLLCSLALLHDHNE